MMNRTMTTIRTYSELIKLPTFEERYRYLKLDGRIGIETFGFDRYINQLLYHSDEWQDARQEVIIRDKGCDLGILDREIPKGKIIVHHMNPISIDDILERNPDVYNPEFLISTILNTHNAIHFGDESKLLLNPVIERRPNDTCPWKS